MASDEDHYRTLGIGRGASKAEVKAAFCRLAQQHHRDRHANSDAAARDGAARRFRRVHDAYSVLYNDTARADYDLRLRSSSSSSASSGGYGHGGSATRGYGYRHGDGGFSAASSGSGGDSWRRPPPPRATRSPFNWWTDAFIW
ncbi:hypothetical protein E2562_020609 [Oryza meyeriana var. granulata]|uniref:J domain-containing protein n=1 Tax=Oryza meyeriana var. granulata TaxID=110450 RepID=A0A6G1DYE9_9ORYZ|nr:hypothetical protein E2562_020609 [Oryza meyeriana var. granulata]